MDKANNDGAGARGAEQKFNSFGPTCLFILRSPSPPHTHFCYPPSTLGCDLTVDLQRRLRIQLIFRLLPSCLGFSPVCVNVFDKFENVNNCISKAYYADSSWKWYFNGNLILLLFITLTIYRFTIHATAWMNDDHTPPEMVLLLRNFLGKISSYGEETSREINMEICCKSK